MLDDFKYFPISRNWAKKLKPIIETKKVQAQLNKDFRIYKRCKEREINALYKSRGSKTTVSLRGFNKGDKPIEHDISDWRCFRVGRPPAFDEYVCWRACHWIVNTLLLIATEAFPKKEWRIVTGDSHSTVWDGDKTFFDLNYMAMKVDVATCYKNTLGDSSHQVLPIGKRRRLY